MLFSGSSILTIAIKWEISDTNILERKKRTKLSIVGSDRFLHLENSKKFQILLKSVRVFN